MAEKGAQHQPDQDQRVPDRQQQPQVTAPTRSSSSTAPARATSTSPGWTLIEHPTQQATFSTVKVPAGTTLGSRFYLLGLSNSGLAAPASAGDTTINVRSTTGMTAGDTIDVDGESRKIATLGTAATGNTTLWRSPSLRARSRAPPARPTCRSRARTASRSARSSASAPAPTTRWPVTAVGRPGARRAACRRRRPRVPPTSR